jgi:hypothetical protein
MSTEPELTPAEAATSDSACPNCTHAVALHIAGLCWQGVIRTPRDRTAKFCGCLTEEMAAHLAALRTTTPEDTTDAR